MALESLWSDAVLAEESICVDVMGPAASDSWVWEADGDLVFFAASGVSFDFFVSSPPVAFGDTVLFLLYRGLLIGDIV